MLLVKIHIQIILQPVD